MLFLHNERYYNWRSHADQSETCHERTPFDSASDLLGCISINVLSLFCFSSVASSNTVGDKKQLFLNDHIESSRTSQTRQTQRRLMNKVNDDAAQRHELYHRWWSQANAIQRATDSTLRSSTKRAMNAIYNTAESKQTCNETIQQQSIDNHLNR